MGQNTLINGNRYGFTDVSLSTNAVQVPKGVLQSLNYTGTQDPGIVQGNQVAPVGRTRGQAQGSGDFEILVSEFDDFNQLITQQGRFPTLSVDFNFEVAYGVNDIDTRIDNLYGVRITNVGSPHSNGNGAIVKTCQLSIMLIKLNGIWLYGDPTNS